MKRSYDPGPPCVVCGKFAINVDHHDAATRKLNRASWAGPSPSMDGQDYYTWAGIEYHAFLAPRVTPSRTDYERGYQAGYHTGIRSREARNEHPA